MSNADQIRQQMESMERLNKLSAQCKQLLVIFMNQPETKSRQDLEVALDDYQTTFNVSHSQERSLIDEMLNP